MFFGTMKRSAFKRLRERYESDNDYKSGVFHKEPSKDRFFLRGSGSTFIEGDIGDFFACTVNRGSDDSAHVGFASL